MVTWWGEYKKWGIFFTDEKNVFKIKYTQKVNTSQIMKAK